MKRGDEQEDVQEEDDITDERLDEVRPGAGDADDLDEALSIGVASRRSFPHVFGRSFEDVV